MHPRAVAAILIAISALLLATTSARRTLAQPSPPPGSPWVMPTTTGPPPRTAVNAYSVNAYSVPAYAAPAPVPAAALAPAREAPTPQKAPPRDYHFDLGVGTEVPISVGGLLTAELPHRFLLQIGVGVLPGAYADAIDGLLVSAGAYDAVVSQVVRGSLRNSAVLRLSAGGRPFEGHGFEILGGYTLITGGGSVTTGDELDAILIESGAPFQTPPGFVAEIPLSATLHNFHASIGWRWLLADDRLVLRASLSYIQTLDSHIDVTIPPTATEVVPYEALINQQVNAHVGPYFSKFAKAPTLGLSAAVRF